MAAIHAAFVHELTSVIEPAPSARGHRRTRSGIIIAAATGDE
jgi:hypothetical protein